MLKVYKQVKTGSEMKWFYAVFLLRKMKGAHGKGKKSNWVYNVNVGRNSEVIIR